MKNFLHFCLAVLIVALAASCSYASVVGIGGYAPDGRVGEEYRAEFEGYGGDGRYLYNLTQDSTLPLGLSFKREDGKYILSGTPREAGEFHFGIEVYALGVGRDVGDFGFRIYGEDEELPKPPEPSDNPPEISDTWKFKELTVDLPTNSRNFVMADNGTSPYSWAVVKGRIPTGMNLSCTDIFSVLDGPTGKSTTGKYAHIIGTPVSVRTYDFTLAVNDAKGRYATKDFSITVSERYRHDGIADPDPTLPTITKASLANGTAGASYSDMLTSDTSGVTWSLTGGKFPEGLSLNENTGAITGTPRESGSFELLITAVKDSASSKEFTLAISPAIPDKEQNDKNDQEEEPGDKDNQEEEDNQDNNDRDNQDQDNQYDEDNTSGILSLRFGYNSTGTVGTSFAHAAPNAYGGKPPYVWSIEEGRLPDGLTLSCGNDISSPQRGSTTGSYAVLDGIPSEAGEFTFRLRVTDSEGSFALHEFTITILPSGIPDDPIPDEEPNSGNPGGGGGGSGGCEVFSGLCNGLAALIILLRK